MEDIRTGRSLGGVPRSVTAGDGIATALVPADPKRARLVLSTAGASLACLGDRSMNLTSYAGFSFGQSPQTWVLTVEEYGNWLCQALFVAGVGAAVTVQVIDLSLEKE